MKKSIVKANDRGTADYGWLKAKYSFSFANYYNPQHVNFGALRVLNDDIIEKGMGFGTHPHDNMEIITIPLQGSLKHKDSMSNTWIPIQTGEVQVMSAGKGIQHSEMNNSTTEKINLFQIWIIPNEQGVEPRYDQKKFDVLERKNKLQVLVTSINSDHSGSLKIHQEAKISRIDLDANSSFEYNLISESNGVFIMNIAGSIEIDNEILNDRDAIKIEQVGKFQINTKKDSQLLFIEVPMIF
ncbi:MAG: pirin family protein [Lutibacter sp.]|uniref:pirin family protein n=1 Tax=Lutibacter sp. TaxID=1925666 RepID=UPI00299F3C5B|nr:pirin family protein [Lutibacter sp.]MDX1829112.1 pirin family protein [Lutibacter sp.]